MTGKFVFAPLFLAIFIAILVSPATNYLDSKKVYPSISVLLTVTVLFMALAGVLLTITLQYNNMIEELPSFADKLNAYSEKTKSFLSSSFGMSDGFIKRSTEQIQTEGKSQLGEIFGFLFLSFSSFLSFAVLVPVFTFLILYYRHSLREFIKNLSSRYDAVTFKKWISTIEDIKDVVRNYLLGVLLVTLVLATLNTAGLAILGVPYPLVLGVSAAVLSIVPYIGNMIGGGLAAIIALASGNIWSAVAVIALFGVIQGLEGNLITPRVMANKVGVNPLVVIVALLIGGYIWGIIGMIVSVPLVAILKVLFDNKESLKPFATLIEGNEK
jgi:predicted PurR-regulated permease PerM